MHTFDLESFHNEMLVYAPKRIHFGYEGMRARMLLAAIDHNHHVDRKPKLNRKGEVQVSRKWSKRGKKWIMVHKCEKKTYNYVPYIISLVLSRRRGETLRYKKSKKIIGVGHPLFIAKNLAEYEGLSSKELAASHCSRFKLQKLTK
jgi:hypothetical protein